MKIFIDTASVEEIKEAASQGLIDGVTTNPSLVAQEKKSHKELIKEICLLLKDQPVSAEVLAVETQEMVKEGRSLAQIHPSVVVKIPLTSAGLKAVKQLSAESIPTNVTLCFSPNQALLAAKAGARYVSVFMGRLDDHGHKGIETVIQSHQILSNYNFKTEVLGASVRHAKHCLEIAQAGIPVCTAPYKVLKQLVKHPLTDIGLEKFLADAKKS